MQSRAHDPLDSPSMGPQFGTYEPRAIPCDNYLTTGVQGSDSSGKGKGLYRGLIGFVLELGSHLRDYSTADDVNLASTGLSMKATHWFQPFRALLSKISLYCQIARGPFRSWLPLMRTTRRA